jgi:hypothetical protein
MKNKLSITFALFILIICTSFGQKKRSRNSEDSSSEKTFRTKDWIYETTIKTVLLYPYTGNVSDYLQPAITPLGQQKAMTLSFDDLKEDFEDYYVKIIHCDADWSKSTLSEIQYLHSYNEFIITNRQTSINTAIPYVHYNFKIPKVKISGNYLVKVYRNYDEDDLILTKRFIVYEEGSQSVVINPDIKYARKVSERNESQQVDFTLSYGNLNIVNPGMSLKVVIRQNHRWDNAIYNLPPLFVRENERILDYNYFNMENGFKGGNEFNAFDISSLQSYKLNVGSIVREPAFYEVFLLTDISRRTQPYSQYVDIDGKFWIEHYETGERDYSPDYALVNFFLEVPEQISPIYVRGAMNDWRIEEWNKMTYDPSIKKYTGRMLLKQGYYNYLYTKVDVNTKKIDDHFITGSHSQTQNQYDILVYYRVPGERADKLIGYRSVNYNAR